MCAITHNHHFLQGLVVFSEQNLAIGLRCLQHARYIAYIRETDGGATAYCQTEVSIIVSDRGIAGAFLHDRYTN